MGRLWLLAGTFAISVLLPSCSQHGRHLVAIRDFPDSTQKELQQLTGEGIVSSRYSAFIHNLPDATIKQLSESENPVLRATAFREMLDRKSFDHFSVIMNHLDDTAMVLTDNGEFGVQDRTVSDDILHEAAWETKDARLKTVDEVLTRHNYLRSAFTILHSLEPREKYYPFIKDMATRPRRMSDDYELDFATIEYALFGLAKFRRQEDIPVIKKQLLRYVWRLSDVSLGLMAAYPDTAYLEVLQQYHRRQFYLFSGFRPHGFTGVRADRAAPEDFTAAVVAQKTPASAMLLDTMLKQLSLRTCMPDHKGIWRDVIYQIWQHPCPAYARLQKQYPEKLSGVVSVQLEPDSTLIAADTVKRKFYWY